MRYSEKICFLQRCADIYFEKQLCYLLVQFYQAVDGAMLAGQQFFVCPTVAVDGPYPSTMGKP
tara:strand:- start:74 stop:262 length:189 start_codon:yes stop_codon:yes gene_type:complete